MTNGRMAAVAIINERMAWPVAPHPETRRDITIAVSTTSSTTRANSRIRDDGIFMRTTLHVPMR